MVIEAVIEDIGLKQRIFADLEASCAPHAILATNTSTIDIELVGAKLKVRVLLLLLDCYKQCYILF
jgi:enoyl-CoA hydratase/3-hydroxyacyl-CoA dehydrogenase